VPRNRRTSGDSEDLRNYGGITDNGNEWVPEVLQKLMERIKSGAVEDLAGLTMKDIVSTTLTTGLSCD
jgi:hypothetical protein